jgi:hypothetical protein
MNVMLKITLSLAIVASLAGTSLADSKRPWKGTADDFYSTNGIGSATYSRTYAAQPQYVVAAPQSTAQRSYSYEPAPSFKVGETAVVTTASSALRIGNRSIATVPHGARVDVIAIQGAWIGVNFDQNGKKVAGWIVASELGK